VVRRSEAGEGSHDRGGALPRKRVVGEAASPGLLREAGPSLLSPVGWGAPGGVIVGSYTPRRSSHRRGHPPLLGPLVMSSIRGRVEEGL
jgi:hypothetical protein